MKFKQVALAVALNLALISTPSHADIIFQSSKAGLNACDNIDGNWTGTGVVTAKVLGIKITCKYQGTGIVTNTDPYKFNLDVDLKSSSAICPNTKKVIAGFCDPVARLIVLSSADAELSGHISEDGRSADDITGKVSITVMKQTILANVDEMRLHKQ